MAIITGGAGNLGAHASRLFVAEGAKVVIDDFNADKGAALADELGAVFDSTDGSTFAERAIDEFGTVDALVLMAGQIPLSPLAAGLARRWNRRHARLGA